MDPIKREERAELVEIGEKKESQFWNNLYLKFKLQDGTETWFYFSEHVDKPHGLKQIPKFFAEHAAFKVGDTMDVTYKVKQSANKSIKFSISHVANHRPKN